MARKRSFFERLTGSSSIEEFEDEFLDEEQQDPRRRLVAARGGREQEIPVRTPTPPGNSWMQEEAEEGELAVDVYQTPDEIIIRTLVAGVKPEDLDISITRDMVTIRGKREVHKEVTEDNYFSQELYWGSFSRTILLPQEIDVELAEAVEKHGLLTLRLPKIDKDRQTKVRVKSG